MIAGRAPVGGLGFIARADAFNSQARYQCEGDRMKRFWMTAAAVLMCLSVHAGTMKMEDRTLITGVDSNAATSFYVERGILDSIKVDVVSSAATGNVTVAINAKTATESSETLVSIPSNTTDTTVIPCRWYTSTAGTAYGATTTAYTNTIITYDGTVAKTNIVISYYSTTAAAPLPYQFDHDSVTVTVVAVTSLSTAKTWRVILRYIEPDKTE